MFVFNLLIVVITLHFLKNLRLEIDGGHHNLRVVRSFNFSS